MLDTRIVQGIHRQWYYTGSDSISYSMVWQVQTEMMGDIHHYAWRARHRNQTVYINKRDSERFGDWTSEQCAVSSVVKLLALIAVEALHINAYHACCLAHQHAA